MVLVLSPAVILKTEMCTNGSDHHHEMEIVVEINDLVQDKDITPLLTDLSYHKPCTNPSK